MAGVGTAHLRPAEDVLVRVEHLSVEYDLAHGRRVKAVSDVSLDIARGEVLAMVGESGCGKTSAARAIGMFMPVSGGDIYFDGRNIKDLKGREFRRVRSQLQTIFQDPSSSLNPRRKVNSIVAEGAAIWSKANNEESALIRARVRETLMAVGLDPDVVGDRRPNEMSGGQCQRVALARALMVEPQMLICDEVVSALDVSVQAQILNLLRRLRTVRALTIFFIAHDLAVVKNISDRVAVLYLGRLCEIGPTDTLFSNASHPYTKMLLASSAGGQGGNEQFALTGNSEPPSPLAPPSGCRFRTRCPIASSRCEHEVPQLQQIDDGRYVACHHHEAR
jgi:peptide/nickel transport system ATP-binding protein